MLQEDVAKHSIHTITSCTAVNNIMDVMEAQTAFQQDNFVKEHAVSQAVFLCCFLFFKQWFLKKAFRWFKKGIKTFCL